MQFVNDPAVHIKGVEGEIRYDWDGRLQLMANVSYQDARDQQNTKKTANHPPHMTTTYPTVPGYSATRRRVIRSTTSYYMTTSYV